MNFPYSFTDRSNLYKIEKLVLGTIATINVKVKKYNFPRLRSHQIKLLVKMIQEK